MPGTNVCFVYVIVYYLGMVVIMYVVPLTNWLSILH